MTKNNLMRLHRLYNAVTAAMLVVSGLLLMWGCLYIYRSGGDEPYTREIVANVFSLICVPVYVTVGLVFVGFVFQLLSPLEEKKARKAKKAVLQERKTELAKNESEGGAGELVGLWRKIRFIRLVSTGIILVLFGRFLAYSVVPANFEDGDITGSVVRAVLVMALAAVLSFGVKLFEIIKCEGLSKKADKLERALMKNDEGRAYIIECKKKGKISDSAKKKIVLFAKIAFVAVAVAALVFGLFSGGTADVLTKAMNICTECIGLG